jgi:hypothetical protein
VNQRLLSGRPSDGLLTLAGELETAHTYLERAPLGASHVRAAATIVAATIEELEESSVQLDGGRSTDSDGSRGLLTLADDLTPVQKCLDPATLTVGELSRCKEIVAAVINLLYWAATDLQIRTLPETAEPSS